MEGKKSCEGTERTSGELFLNELHNGDFPIWMYLEKLKIEIQYTPAVPLLGVYLKNM